MVNPEGTSPVAELTQREREVVILIGRDRLSYKAAAKMLQHSSRDGHVTWRTVSEYAQRIRDKVGSSLLPKDALTELYWTYRAELETASEPAA